MIALVVVVAVVAVAVRLGFWQLDRAAQKTLLQASLDERSQLPPLGAETLARTAQDAEAQLHRRTAVSGQWLADRTVYLDNRQMDARVGFIVVTPLALTGIADAAVLVQRGFVARNFADRSALPPFATTAGLVTVTGTIATEPTRVYDLGGAGQGTIRQNLDTASFARESALHLLPFTIVEQPSDANSGDGLLRHWAPPASGVQKHYGYALQWFALAAALVIGYVWHRFFRPVKR